MKPIPRDTELYEKVKKKLYKDMPKHSAYRSGILVQKYKKAFLEKHGKGSPYIGKKTKKIGLKRWFDEEWVNQRGEVGYKFKNDIYRPSKRITKKTPTIHKELTKNQIRKARTQKYRKGRVNKFSAIKKGGKWTRKYKLSIDCKNPKGFSQKQHCKHGRSKLKKIKASAILNKKNGVHGYIEFENTKKGVIVSYNIKGMVDGEHGFHIHELAAKKCDNAGPHFNPNKHTHGSRKSHKRHVGDLGNITSKNGVAKGSFIDNVISLNKNSKNSIINRTVVVHDLKDDLGKGRGNKKKESKITGNAGKRLNCGLIKIIN